MLILKNQRIHIRKFKDLELPAAVKAFFGLHKDWEKELLKKYPIL